MTTLPSTVQERIALPTSDSGGGDGPTGGITGADIFAMLRRRMITVVAMAILFSGLAGGGFAVWWFYFPGYRSECLIECISDRPNTQLTFDEDRIRRDEHDAFVKTQALLLKSPVILSEALKLTAVRETGWHRSTPDGRHLLQLTDELSASPVTGTNFLRVAMSCRAPEDARTIVAAVVRQWYEFVRERSAEDFTTERLEAGRAEYNTLDQKIRGDRGRLGRIAERLAPGMRLDPGRSATQEQVRLDLEKVTTLRLELAQLMEYRAIYSDPAGVAVTPEDRALVEQDPEVAQLVQAVFVLKQQRASDMSKYGESHTVIKQTDAQLVAAEEELTPIREEKLREVRAEKLELVTTAVEATRQALLLAEDNLARSEAALQDQDGLLFEYTTLEEEIKRNDESLVELDDYIKSLQRVVRQQSAVRVTIAQQATEPLERNSPNVLLLPVGMFLAMALAVGITLLSELLDTSVRTARDVVRHLDIAMLGTIPDIDDEEIKIARVETAVRDAPRSMVAEAFRRIRTNLQFTSPANRQRHVLVTSPRPDDGKTTVACNLAIAVAQAGRRVLLVDANFRRPALAKMFGKSGGSGLSNLLIGEGTLASHVVKTDLPALDLLSSGPVPPNPAELLNSEQSRAFLEEATSRYDQIIIDTAPVLLASDALALSSAVDGVILVVRANKNSRGLARRAWHLLTDVNAHLFGAVLNAAQVTRGGYFREQLRAYYDYQSDEEGGAGQLPAPPAADPSND